MSQNSNQLIQALQNPNVYNHPVDEISLIETHISWVLLTGDFVYKIKKPVNLGFLDFSSLDKREKYCHLEVNLNKRLASDYYLEVVAIKGDEDQPALNGDGEAFEYAVKMRQFPQQTQLDRVLAKGQLTEHHMDLLAEKIAHFHQNIQVADENQVFGDLSHVHTPVENCFKETLNRIDNQQTIQRVEKLREWGNAEFSKLKPLFQKRKTDGFIRECHGDLHLRNIAIVDEEVIAFDGIEFSDNLRWNDLMSEVAFLVMDLQDHGKYELASQFLNRYLEISGDYLGLQVFRYYLLYRAIVRAMVSCIRLNQSDLADDERSQESDDFQKYLSLAESYTHTTTAKLFITHGMSGSGKSTVSRQVMQSCSAIRIRSDIERKRLSGLNETQREKKGMLVGIYDQSTSEKTYQYLAELAGTLLDSQYFVIVDAAFLKKDQRNLFIALARKHNIELKILTCVVPIDMLRQRLVNREEENKDVSDADISVLEYQIKNADELTEEEMKYSIQIEPEVDINILIQGICES